MTQQIPQSPASELEQMGQALVQDQRRIATMQNPTNAALATEVSGTVLAYVRDLIGYVARFEQSVVVNFNGMVAAVEEIQANGPGGEDEQTTQFEPEDAAKFTDFIEGCKVLLAATKDAAGTVESAKQQIQAMLGVADELLELVRDNTLEEVQEEETAPEIVS